MMILFLFLKPILTSVIFILLVLIFVIISKFLNNKLLYKQNYCKKNISLIRETFAAAFELDI